MNTRTPAALAAAGALAAALAGCGDNAAGSSGTPVKGAQAVTVTITDAGCTVRPAAVHAGPATFTVTNRNSSAVTEYELLSGSRILGERENLTPGLSGTFSLNLQAGSYTSYCPGADTEKTTLAVHAAPSAAPSASADPRLAAATRRYAGYVRAQAALLVSRTRAFTTAVEAGRLAEAKQLYVPARIPYERIEPVAESFGNLDPEIDARVNDVSSGQRWTGFHRIEKALWVQGSTAGMKPFASKLMSDVLRLQRLVATQTYQPAELANGAGSLLDEVAKSKVTGEEERYSHVDLVDFQANIDGAREAFDLLRPALQRTDPSLAGTVAGRFRAVDTLLARYGSGSRFVRYGSLDAASVRALANAVDALAEPLSQVAGKVVAR